MRLVRQVVSPPTPQQRCRRAGVVLGVISSCGFIVMLLQSRGSNVETRSRRDLAALAISTYLYEAWPRWASEHSERCCPDDLSELDRWSAMHDHLDPWGREYRMTCVEHGIRVVSAGEDGRFGTTDDVEPNR